MIQSSTLLDMFLQTLEPHPKCFEGNNSEEDAVKEKVDQNNNKNNNSAQVAAEVVQSR